MSEPARMDAPTPDGNIIGMFRHNVERWPEKPALLTARDRLTYRELALAVESAAAEFSSRDIVCGNHVLVVLPMAIELYVVLLALFHLGATAVFVDAWGDRSRLDEICRSMSIRAFIGSRKAHLSRLLLPALRRVPLALSVDLARWRRSVHPATPPAALPADTDALITFTTGTTGQPKGARRTHGLLLAQHRALREALLPSPDDVDMPLLPVFVLNNLAVGSTTFLPPVDSRNVVGFRSTKLVELIRIHHVSTIVAPPAFYRKLVANAGRGAFNVSSIRSLFVGGATVAPALARSIIDAFPGARAVAIYGSTEAEPIAAIDCAQLARLDATHGLAVGRPVRSTHVRILDLALALKRGQIEASAFARGAAVAGAPGEICVAGDHVLREYVGSDDSWRLSRIVLDNTIWIRTGDAGFIDGEGVLHLLGRLQQSFVHNGTRWFVLPIELAIASVEGVRDGTVVTIGGEAVAFVEADVGRDGTGLKSLLRERGVPCDRLVILRHLPRDRRHRSRIDYEALAERYRG